VSVKIGAAVVALGLLAGCCTPQPARLDPVKVKAFRDEVAATCSMSLLWCPPELVKDIGLRNVKVNEDCFEITGR